MSLRVVAVVISNDQPNFLESALNAIERQSFRPERVLVVDTSTNNSVDEILNTFVSKSSKHAVLKITDRADLAELAATGIKQALGGYASIDDVALWLVHDDCTPEVHALAELVRTLELSPLVGIASPKQLAMDNPKLIVQQGLTVTKTFRPFSIVSDELDQKQHDSMSDVLAVSTNAMLIRANLWAELGGLSVSAPELAKDIELGIRTHLAGFRVVVVPTARVRHAELSVNDKRPRKWLGGSHKFALAKATNHLRLSQYPLMISFLYWLFLPVISLIQVFWLMFVKRPDRIGFTLRANLWAFMTVRARLRDRHGMTTKSLRPLMASRAQVRARALLGLDRVEQKTNLEQFDKASASPPGLMSFAASGGLWIMLVLAGLSYQFFPLGQAATGGFALPLSDSWLALFANTGASYQHIGLGLAAPSDPFNWILLTLGSLTFFNPNLALSWLLLLAKPLAFFGAWRFTSTLTYRTSLRIICALLYVFWPSFTLAQTQGNYPAVVFAITLPWLLFSLARASRIGLASSIRSVEQNWSWLAASGLLFFVACASAPSSLFLLLVVFFIFAFMLKKKLAGALLVILPTIVLSGPYWFFHLVGNKQLLGVLADPTLSSNLNQINLLTSLTTSNQIVFWFAIGTIGFSLLALLAKRKVILLFWLVALLAVANLWFMGSIKFAGGGMGSIFLASSEFVQDSPTPTVMFFVVCLVAALAIWLDSLTRSAIRKSLLVVSFLGALLPFVYGALVEPSLVRFQDSRNLPAIFTAAASSGAEPRLLVINSAGNQRFNVEVIRSSGLKLDSVSTAYRLSSANTSEDYPGKTQVANLVANLVSANGKTLSKDLQAAGITYVLVPESSSNGDIQVSLNSAAELDQVGNTEFGQLWRVKHPTQIKSDVSKAYWSLTKSVQLAFILGFVLLALPTSRGRKQRETNEFAELEVEVEQ